MAEAFISPRPRRMAAGPKVLSVIGFLAVAVLVILVNLSALLTARAPATAASLFFANGKAQGRLAQQIVTASQTSAAAQRAITLAQDAVLHDPTVPEALLAAGLAFDIGNQPARARSAMTTADRLSRRMLPVQIWLIESAARSGDVAAALHEMDIALRTSRKAQEILFPVLNAALDDPQILPELAQILSTSPAWRQDFTLQLTSEGSFAGASALSIALARMRSPMPAEYVSLLMLRLSRTRDYARANAVFRATFRRLARPGILVRDSTFAHPGTALPFGWQFSDGGDIGVAAMAAGHHGAQLYASSTGAGEAARQLIMLSPGSYRLRATYANAEIPRGRRPRWQVACGMDPLVMLAELPLVTGTNHNDVLFTVPKRECPAQWIFLTVSPGVDEGNLSVDLIKLSIDQQS